MIVLALATFVSVLGIIFGLYWFFVARPEEAEHEAVRKRLGKAAKGGSRIVALLKPEEKLSQLGALNSLLVQSGRVMEPLRRSIEQSGLKVTPGTIILASACFAALGFTLVMYFLQLPLVGAAVAGLAACIPFGYVHRARTQRMLKFEEQFPEAIDLLARALRAGHALTTGLLMVAEELPEPIGPEFKLLYDQQNFGLPVPRALRDFAERIPSIDARFFVTAVLTQREAGGNLSEVLDNLASIIRERFKVKRQVRVISAHGRITGWCLAALPTALALFFTLMNPEKYATFYKDPLGMQMIAGALFLQVIGVFIIRKIVNIEY
jgi:tight adherence protein B